jgi:hypothetical protein
MVVISILMAGMVAGVMNACDNVRLSLRKPSELTSTKAAGEICAAVPDKQKNYTKIMFLMDKSGSNKDSGDALGTDNDKSYRFNLVNDYFQRNRANDELMWSFVAFNHNGAKAFINGGSDQVAVFTPDTFRMEAALARFMTDADDGQTPYRAALNMAIQTIADDRLKSNKDGISPTYVVVLVSDGAPSDYFVVGSTPQIIDESAIDTDVLKLTGADTTLSTVYYAPAIYSETLPNRLERMAKLGGGKFSNVNVDGKIPIDSLIKFGSAEPWKIKRFVVTNLNAAPCDDGTIDADSDADGLCDKDELRYNTELASNPNYAIRMKGQKFDPQNRNSFSSVYNDLIMYRYILYNEAVDSNCTDTSDADKDLLNYCEERFMKSNTPSGPTNFWEQQMRTDTDPKNPDSDGDGFLDFHEFIFALGRMTSEAMDNKSLTAYPKPGVAINMEQVLLQHRNPRAPSNGVAYDGSFEFTHVNDQGQNCYRYDQKTLPLYNTKALLMEKTGGRTQLAHLAGENAIMIYFVQTSEKDQNGPGELRTLIQKKRLGEPVDFNLDIEDYDSYLADQARVSPTRTAEETKK